MTSRPTAEPVTSWAAFDRAFAEAFPSSHTRNRSHDSSTGDDSSSPATPPATAPRRERIFKQASEEVKTTVKTVPSTSERSRTGRHRFSDDDNDGMLGTVPGFEESSRKVSTQTTLASGPGSHRRGDSWSSSSSGPTLRKKRSRVTFKDSADGRTKSAIFELPGIAKKDINVSFQIDKVVVSWHTVKMSEKQEGDRLVRERREKKSSKSLPLPPGVDFDSVKATMEGDFLTIHYPSTSRSKEHINIPVD